jgi:hypothetical protein
VLKYHGALHRYIKTEKKFMDIFSLGAAYRYAIKIEQKLNKIRGNLGLENPHRKIQEREAPTHRTKDRGKMGSIKKTSSGCKKIRMPKRKRKISRSSVTSIRSLGITILNAIQSSHWWPNLKPMNQMRVLNLSQNYNWEDRSLTWNPIPSLLPPSSSLVI